jgi:carbon monoxide dehydrogenase subunit G
MNTLITKDFEIAQPIDIVWKSLANPEEIVGCVPGASITEKIDDKNYKGQVVTKFGPIKAAYAGDVQIVELDEPNYKMVLKGRGLDSKGKGSADMIMNGILTEDGGKTQVKFSMDITIIGKLAQFGSRLINDVSDQLLNEFVKNFSNQLESQVPEASVEVTSDAATESGVDAVKAAVTETKDTVAKVTKPAPAPDNSFDGTSLIGTVIKSIFGGILDFFKGLFRMKK